MLTLLLHTSFMYMANLPSHGAGNSEVKNNKMDRSICCFLIITLLLRTCLTDNLDLGPLSPAYDHAQYKFANEIYNNLLENPENNIVTFNTLDEETIEKICENFNVIIYITNTEETINCEIYNNQDVYNVELVNEQFDRKKRHANVSGEPEDDEAAVTKISEENGKSRNNTEKDENLKSSRNSTSPQITENKTTSPSVTEKPEVTNIMETESKDNGTNVSPKNAIVEERNNTIGNLTESKDNMTASPTNPEKLTDVINNTKVESGKSNFTSQENVTTSIFDEYQTTELVTTTQDSVETNSSAPSEASRNEGEKNDTRLDLNNTRVDQNNTRVDQNNTRVDQNNTRVDQNNTRVDQNNTRVDQNNTRADQNNTRADQNNTRDGTNSDKGSGFMSKGETAVHKDSKSAHGSGSELKEKSSEGPKDQESSQQPTKASSKDSTILIVLFAAVVLVGIAAFSYNYIQKRKRRNAQSDSEAVERGSALRRSLNSLTKAETGPENKPLLKQEQEMVELKNGKSTSEARSEVNSNEAAPKNEPKI